MTFITLDDCNNLTGKAQARCFLHLAIQAEHDAVNLYNAMAEHVDYRSLDVTVEEFRSRMHHVAREEHVHIGEFTALLEALDDTYRADVDEGKQEAQG